MEEEKKSDEQKIDQIEIDLGSDPSRRDFFAKVLAVAGAVAATSLLNTATGEAADPPLMPLKGAPPMAARGAALPMPLKQGELLQAGNLSMQATGLNNGMSIRLSGTQLSQALAREGLGINRGGQAMGVTLSYT